MRFLGRKVYLAAVVVLVAAMAGAVALASPGADRVVRADRRTIASWLRRRRAASRTIRSACVATPCGRTVARCPCNLPCSNVWRISTTRTRTGPVNCTTTICSAGEGRCKARSAAVPFDAAASTWSPRACRGKPRLEAEAIPWRTVTGPAAGARRDPQSRPPTLGGCGISTSITARCRSSLHGASGSGRWRWASSTITRYRPHPQWYLSETTEDLVHGFSQGIQRGLPRGDERQRIGDAG